ncbi:uncharacterized protein TNCV_387971 [Trichonephila clavipes]|nr:uncharacterized protein TNCV_387971 [Trichonephila clavipes]
MVHTVTLVDGRVLKSAVICGRVGRLPRLMILISRHWSRSCMFFFRPQRCHKFDVLPDSRYLRYTREMVVRENSNFIATSKTQCSISRAVILAPDEGCIETSWKIAGGTDADTAIGSAGTQMLVKLLELERLLELDHVSALLSLSLPSLDFRVSF